MNCRKFKQLVAVCLSIYIVIAITFSYTFLIEHMNHHCTGTDCEICFEMDMAVHMASIGAAVLFFAPILYFRHRIETMCNKLVFLLIIPKTLISNKVRLND